VVAFQLFLFSADSEVHSFSQYQELLKGGCFTDVAGHGDALISANKPR
jgi:hypothetical protein